MVNTWFINKYPHLLYKMYDKMGCLLYVGITYDPRTRMNKHRRDSMWWNDHVYVEYTWYKNRVLATAAERMSIILEEPVYNIQKIQPNENIGPS